jgi:hypothetical protein
MKLPNWFKITWWVIILLMTGIILSLRVPAILSGQSVPADIFVFFIFVALMLVPIFSEIELFGIKLKKEIEEIKRDINIKLGEIKNEIRNNQNQTVSQTFQTYGPPPPDNKLPELQAEIERILNSKFKDHNITPNIIIAGRIDVPDENLLMFKIRYNIEKQLVRIWEQRFDGNEYDNRLRHQSVARIIQDLSKFEIIDGNFYGILKEILSICNYAIHGDEVTENQVAFVSKNAKLILDYLYQVK